MRKVSQTLEYTVLQKAICSSSQNQHEMCQGNTSKDVLAFLEIKWHASLTLEQRTRNQEGLAFYLVLLLTLAPTPCHLLALRSPCASVSPATFCSSVDQSCSMYFFKERKNEKEAKRGKEGMERHHHDNCASLIEGMVQISSPKLGSPGLCSLPTVFNVLLCLSESTCNCYRSLFTDVQISEPTQQPY